MIVLTESILWSPSQIEIIEQNYHAKYLLETCLKNKDGGWVNFPAAIFYTEIPHPKGSNYFAIFRDIETKKVMICNGISAITEPISGLLIDDKVIYSRYRHDYREFNGIIVDGGRDYFRIGGARIHEAKEVKIKIYKDEIIVNEVFIPATSYKPSTSFKACRGSKCTTGIVCSGPFKGNTIRYN